MHGYQWIDLALPVLLCLVNAPEAGVLQTERFDAAPAWDGWNNRSTAFETRSIEQDFGYAAERSVGDHPGAIGGLVTPIGVPAYYARPVKSSGFDEPLSASGTLRVEPGAGNTLFGFFNAGTLNEWRTPNTVVFRINGRGEVFHVHIEFATAKWRAGASVIGRYDSSADRMYPLEIPSGGTHTWAIAYDPEGAGGRGEIVATFDEHRAVCPLADGFKTDGATFDRFGILNVVKHADGPGTLWLGNLVINGETTDLAQDPGWEGRGNRTRYESGDVRPRFDFGYSATQHAGGVAPGEIGGLFFRGDCRYPEKLAYYGAMVGPLTLDRPIRAEGKFALRRGVTDSTTLFGFFHSRHSVLVNESQKYAYPLNFLGIAIEGPSSEGFFAYPVYRTHGDGHSSGIPAGSPRVYPDGASHTWSLEFTPARGDVDDRITLTVDEVSIHISIDPADRNEGATFDRFGFITPWIDGNGQVVYFDDLTFTSQ
ncbi:MAG: hypothetical protein AMXMBFR82_39670 [Candidatus Hydrogenedentota bacterium]